MNLEHEQIEHLRKAHEFAAKACDEFMRARLPLLTVSTSMEIGDSLARGRDLMSEILRRYPRTEHQR